jgi:CDGSH-type Zn-finger protein
MTAVSRVEELCVAAEAAGTPASIALAGRLRATVLRPLAELGEPPALPAPVDASAVDLQAALLALAIDLTEACVADERAALLEACAGAHYLVTIGGTEGLDELAARARRIPSAAAGRIRVRAAGPYLLTGSTSMWTFLGERIAAPSVAALCRCGQSRSRPWCDGTHATIGFDDAKHVDRVPDRLDSYEARQFTILDNRGLCAHSARCTDALPTAFRARAEPFVAPAGARADDVLRAVQACPSGALGIALTERRADELIDRLREPGIEVSKDGPYFVTGGVELTDEAGHEPARPAGASKEHFSLCRCGQSKNKPFCSGAHWYADFHDPVADPDHQPTLFEWAGGYPVLLRTTRIFYERYVPQDDLLAPLFARMQPDHPERVAAWLSEVFGGPGFYSQRYGGYARMISQHLSKQLTEAQRSRWVSLLCRAAEDALMPADPEFRAAFVAYLEWGSRIAVENSQHDSRPPEGMPVPRWWWVCDATPAARPSSRPSQGAPVEDLPPPATLDPGEGVSFERHVRGLFRARDRGAMRFAFDLWSAADVRTHAQAIQARLRDGTMPCDGAWPAEKLAIFERWIAGGCAD